MLHDTKKLTALFFAAATMLLGSPLRAQTLIDNYRFSTGVDTTKWIDITGMDSTLIEAPASGLMYSGRSGLMAIGFSYSFAGTSYTSFSVNCHGTIRLGGMIQATFQDNSLTQSFYMPQAVLFGSQGVLDSTCHVSYATLGDSGSRVLVVEARMKIYNTDSTYVSGQVQLYEATGDVRIVYGVSSAIGQATASKPGLAKTTSDILFIDHAAHSVQRLTGAPLPTNEAGVWPEQGRYYSFVPDMATCPFPSAPALLNNQPDSITLGWNGVLGGTAWRLSIPQMNIDTVLSDTSFTFGGMEPVSSYNGTIQTICGGDTSLRHRSFSFTTGCGTIHRLPWTDDFQVSATDACWSKNNRTYANRWQRVSSSNNYYMRSGYSTVSSTVYNEWLVSPRVLLADTAGLTLNWWYRCEQSNNNAPKVRVRLLVCDTVDEVDTTAAWVTLATIDDYEQYFQAHSIMLDAYAGHRVRIAFQHFGSGGRYACVDNVGIEVRTTPTVTLQVPAGVAVGDTTVVVAQLISGLLSNPHYSWFSTMENRGLATLLQADDTLKMVYLSTGRDTVTLTVSSDYGNSTVTAIYNVCGVVSDFPWNEGFENGIDCWLQDDNSTWQITNTDQHSGAYSLGSYNTSSHSNIIVSQLVEVPTDAYMLRLGLWGKLNANNTSATSNISVLIGNANTTDWSNATVIGTVTVNYNYQYFELPLDAYAGQTVCFALRHSNANKIVYVDDLSIRYKREPTGSLAVSSSMVYSGDTVTATVSLAEGDTTNISYQWESFMDNYGLATLIGSGTEASIEYYTAGIDTVIVTVTNAYGTFTDTAVVRICPIIDSLPWIEDFNIDFNCWQVLRGQSEVANNNLNIIDWNTAVVTPSLDLPDEDNLMLDFSLIPHNVFYGYLQVLAATGSLDSLALADTLENIVFGIGTYTGGRYRISLDAYRGERIHLVFCFSGEWWYPLEMSNLMVRSAREPVVSLTLGGEYFLNTPIPVTATLLEGDTNSITYFWTSTMTERGDADIVFDGGPQATLTCYTGGVDTVTVTVTNDYGSDSAWSTVIIIQCSTVDTFPWIEDFSTGLSCWWQPPISPDTWNQNHWVQPDYGDRTMAAVYNFNLSSDNWLVSRPISLPNIVSDEDEGVQLWWDAASLFDRHHAYCVMVTTGPYDSLAGYDTLAAFNTEHPLRSDGWDTMRVDLSDYAGLTIHLAFRYTTEQYQPDGLPGVLLIDNVRIFDTRPVQISVLSPTRCFVDDTAIYRVRYTHGVRSGANYVWSSALEQRGLATAYSVDSLFYVVYHAALFDTVSLTATNVYGSDSTWVRVPVYNCPVQSVPWYEDFSVISPCWIGPWVYAYDAYGDTTVMSTTDGMYISPAVDLPDSVGLQLAWTKTDPPQTGSPMRVFVSPFGGFAPEDFTDTIVWLNTNTGRDSVSLDAYAGHRIRVAFSKAVGEDWFYLIDDVSIDYDNSIPTLTLAAPDTVFIGNDAMVHATLTGGLRLGTAISWHSSLTGAVVSGDPDSNLSFPVHYTTIGTDTVTCVVTNINGSNTATAIVRVVDSAAVANIPVVTIVGPSAVDAFDTVAYTAQLLAGDTVGLVYTWHSAMRGPCSIFISRYEISYDTVGTDTITLVAANSHGADTAVLVVNVAWPAEYRHTVTLASADSTLGLVALGTQSSASASQTVPHGGSVTFRSVAFAGCHFVRWSDNVTDMLRTITVISDTTLVAYFEANESDTLWRTVLVTTNGAAETYGSGLYVDGSTVEIGYHLTDTTAVGGHWQFLGWDDGGTGNPRDILVTSDTAIVALFEWDGTDGVDATSNSCFTIFPNPASTMVTVETDRPSTLTLTDAIGRECGRWHVGCGKTTIDISPIPAGIYFVRLATSSTVRKLIAKKGE